MSEQLIVLEKKIAKANEIVKQFCDECMWGPDNQNNCDEDADDCRVFALKQALSNSKPTGGKPE